MPHYAHTLQSPNGSPAPESEWEPLFTPFGDRTDECQREHCEKCRALDPKHGHLNKVAFWTAKFASDMFAPGSPEAKAAHQWGYLAGLWHDLGKFSREFQERLRGERERADHSTGGAQHAATKCSAVGQLFAYLIAGHHAGLADWNKNGSGSDLMTRLRNRKIPEWTAEAPPEIRNQPNPPRLPFLSPTDEQGIAFFARLLFSCLVDADFIATEAFMSAKQRGRRLTSPSDILERMDRALDARDTAPQTVINRQRERVRVDCVSAADKETGLFTLTVPTGGGKTLSSLAFAVRHAKKHDLKRIIYVIPYTSIIEQNAKVFRDAFKQLAAELTDDLASGLVLEHHSNFELEGTDSLEIPIWKLSAENWNAPLIVTTSVQFFESLYANRPSQCRKLHNIARSVIILDEAQNLPVDLLAPCLESIRQVTKLAGSSIVLCTATQPAIGKRRAATDAFNRIALDLPANREIVRNVPALFEAFQRVTIHREPDPLSDDELACRVVTHDRVLCILNTKRHATAVFDLVGREDPANLHLSAQLCPVHREAVLNEIKRREIADEPCRVIATTVVEAGVDLDFPVVFRALTGLDSLAQAAGRCNRHGARKDDNGNPTKGTTIFFTPADQKTPTFLTQNVNSTDQVINDHVDLLSPEAIEHYFRMHYWMSGGQDGRNWDRHDILPCFQIDRSEPRHPFGFNFKTAADKFRLIPDTQAPVIVPPAPNLWPGQDEAKSAKIRQLLDTIRHSHSRQFPPPTGAHRRLQRYTIQIPKLIHADMLRTGAIQMYHDRFPILTHPEDCYDSKLGLMTSNQFGNSAAFMI